MLTLIAALRRSHSDAYIYFPVLLIQPFKKLLLHERLPPILKHDLLCFQLIRE